MLLSRSFTTCMGACSLNCSDSDGTTKNATKSLSCGQCPPPFRGLAPFVVHGAHKHTVSNNCGPFVPIISSFKRSCLGIWKCFDSSQKIDRTKEKKVWIFAPDFFLYWNTLFFTAILFESFMLKSFLLTHLCAKPKKNFCIEDEEEDEKRNVSTIAKCLNRKFSRGKVHCCRFSFKWKSPVLFYLLPKKK